MILLRAYNDMRCHIIVKHEKTYRHASAMSANFFKDPVHTNLALMFASTN